MEKDRKKSYRRFKAWVKQKSRLRFCKWVEKYPRRKGRLKDGHFGCGCSLCKPWKWGKEDSLKISEKRKL